MAKYNYKSETKKLNKGALIGIFTAILMLSAIIFGWLYFDTNKKYDIYKKDCALTLDKAQADKTILQTQLESKQAELEELQANATSNASQIELLQNEIESLENQLLNYENISKNFEDATLSYACQIYDISYYVDSEQDLVSQVSFFSGSIYLGSIINELIEHFDVIANVYVYDRYDISVSLGTNSCDFQLQYDYSSDLSQCVVNLVNSEGNSMTFENDRYYRLIDYSANIVLFSEDELSSLGYNTETVLIKSVNLNVALQIEQNY